MIPLTLFYDETDKVYLEKQAEVKVYICDESGNVIRTIGKTQLNIAEYVNDRQFALQVLVESQNKKRKQEALITFKMLMERQDDDSKSVNSFSQDESQFKSKLKKKSKDSKEFNNKSKDTKDKSKEKQSNRFLNPISRNLQLRSTEEKTKRSSNTEQDEKFSCDSRNSRFNQKQKIKQPRVERFVQQQPMHQESEDKFNSFFDKITPKFDDKHNLIEAKNNQSRHKTQHNKKQQKSYNNLELSPSISEKQDKTPSSNIKQDAETKNMSPELKFYQITKKMQSFKKENDFLKKQKNNLQSIISKMLQEKSQSQLSQHTISTQSQKSLDYYKNLMSEKNIKINQLEGQKKIIEEIKQQKQFELKKTKLQLADIKLKLEHQKNKIAKLVQAAMESENMDLLELVQKELNDEYF